MPGVGAFGGGFSAYVNGSLNSAKGTDTGQYNMARIPDHVRITRHHRLMPHCLEGLGNTAEIAHAIVDNRNHIHFVEAKGLGLVARGKTLIPLIPIAPHLLPLA